MEGVITFSSPLLFFSPSGVSPTLSESFRAEGESHSSKDFFTSRDSLWVDTSAVRVPVCLLHVLAFLRTLVLLHCCRALLLPFRSLLRLPSSLPAQFSVASSIATSTSRGWSPAPPGSPALHLSLRTSARIMRREEGRREHRRVHLRSSSQQVARAQTLCIGQGGISPGVLDEGEDLAPRVCVRVAGGVVEGCVPCLALELGVRLVLQQRSHDVDMPVLRSEHEGSDA